MASQGLSRKRPAPESPPMSYQPPMAQSTNGYGAAVGPQLSDEQFLQWGQTAQPPNQYNDPATYHSMNSMPPSTAQASNQLARRPVNQIATRSKQTESANNMWLDGAGGSSVNTTQQQVDSAWGDDLDELERKATIAKKEAQGKRKQIPPFVQKLNSFLENGKNTDLIRWSDDGNSFIVLDEEEFAKTLIPELFKHNNYASFVRQLNMYGFHKKVGLSDNSMRASERKNKSPSEYSNPYFRRGHPGLLWLIQKPRTTPANTKGKGKRAGSEQNDDDAEEYMDDMANIDQRMHPRPQLAIDQGEAGLSTEKFQSVQRELATIRRQQQQILGMMQQLKREHEQLYGQAANFQDQHTRHEKSINAILTFLATVYQRGGLNGNEAASGIAASGIAGLFANSGVPHDTNQGNVVDVGDYNFDGLNGETFGKPLKKQPLLLQGPPSDRGNTVSPNPSNDTYTPRMTRRSSQALRQGSTPVATVEEVFDSNAPTPMSPRQHARKLSQQAEIMSMIQNSNARSTPSTPADFSNVLNDLEHNGGNTPLTQSQRANMLRLMSDSAGQGGDNALVNATPPAIPKDYTLALQRSQADLDSLARLQAEQDRSVQNLTELLQPLSPTGSIPGLHDGQYLPPPPLDIDNFLNQDYFNEFPSELNYDFSENGNGMNGGGIGLNDLPNEEDDELFGDVSHLRNDEVDFDGNPINGGRVESIASSEVTTPNTSSTVDVNGDGPQTRSFMKGRRLSGEMEKSPGKRRKRNA